MALANRRDDINCPHCGKLLQKAIYEKLPNNFIGHSNVIGWENVEENHKCKEQDEFFEKLNNDPEIQKLRQIVNDAWESEKLKNK